MLKNILRCVLTAALYCSIGGAQAETSGQFDAATGLFKIHRGGAPIVEASLQFWRGDWHWAGLSTVSDVTEPARRYTFKSRDFRNGLTIDGDAETSSDGTGRWRLQLSEAADGAPDMFGAIVFRLSPMTITRPGFVPVAELRADNMGWSLALDPDGGKLEVAFDSPVVRLEFERGNPNEIRAYLVQRNAQVDTVDVRMQVTFPGRFDAAPTERLARPSETWWANDLHWNRTPVDLSQLNAADKPAGKRGFLRASGENLVFADGTKARFWGTNLSAHAIFQYRSPELVRVQARRLSQLGFNLVRIHHHDSHWAQPNVFGRDARGTRTLDPHAMEQIDRWIKALKDEGIYVWLDLHVGRELSSEDDIEAFAEIANRPGKRTGMQGYLYVNNSLKARMREFAAAYLSHVNPHTGLAYKDDPAIVTILITNENDLTHHFGNSLLPDKNVPWHTRQYIALARKFAVDTGLDYDQVWRSWEFGPSKLFLSDLEHAYFSDVTQFLRDKGVKVPIIGTSYWGEMSVAGLPSLSQGDIVDAHAYGRADDVSGDPRFAANLVSWMSGGSVSGRPFSVSEWNVEPFPVFDRFQVPAHLASVASLQGWNALLQYAYSQSPLHGGSQAGNWELISDPAMMSMMPAAALLFRAGHVKPATTSYELALPPDVFSGRETNARTSRAIRTLTEKSKLRIRIPEIAALPWLKAAPPVPGVKQIADPDYDAIGEGASKVCSDTGELCRDWSSGVFTLNTDQSQIASGWLGGQTVHLRDVSIALTTPSAAVAVQSLDDAPVVQSAKLMISLAAQSTPSPGLRLPYRSEPVEGEIRIRAARGLKAFKADRDGKLHAVPFEDTEKGYVLRLTPEIRTQWLFLQ